MSPVINGIKVPQNLLGNLIETNLYESNDTSPAALTFSESLLKFTEYAIQARVKFRKTHPYRPADDMPYIKMGIAPGTDLPPELQAKMDRLKSQKSAAARLNDDDRERDDSKNIDDELAPANDQLIHGMEGDLKRPKTVE